MRPGDGTKTHGDRGEITMERVFNIRLSVLPITVLIVILLIPAYGQTKRIRPAAEHTIFKCRRLINPASGLTIENAAIEVNNGKILRVGKASEFSAAEGIKVVDYADKFVIPGLIDTHGHLYGRLTDRFQTTHPAIPAFFLAAGVTAVGSP